uniref:Uncharacterized protein n=1 Tax=Nothobranchius furzeri TaxID=105023 RepID=A0A8C6KGQ7_NOTFU
MRWKKVLVLQCLACSKTAKTTHYTRSSLTHEHSQTAGGQTDLSSLCCLYSLLSIFVFKVIAVIIFNFSVYLLDLSFRGDQWKSCRLCRSLSCPLSNRRPREEACLEMTLVVIWRHINKLELN